MHRRLKTGLILIILATLASSGYFFYRNEHRSTAPLTLYGNIDIRTVELSFRVGGRIKTMAIDEGDSVHPGQVIATLDAKPYKIALKKAQALHQAAQANLDLLQAGYRSEQIARAQQQVKQLESAYHYAQRSYQRFLSLRHQQAISQDQLDSARNQRDQAQADLKAAEQQLTQYQQGNRPQQIEQAQAQLQEAQASVEEAKLNLSDTQLHAPSDGTILVRAHQPGAIVATGTTVFTLALNHPLWVKAYIDEVNLGQARPGRKVFITTDSAPNHIYHGHIGFISPIAEFTPKTVQTEQLRTSLVYRLRIIVDDSDNRLRQGMPVTVRFAKTKTHHE
ncbi:MAG: hypothetical protein CENE_01065 [Candidatus Celerinatantimonas neptuna]|nr:MAG: hypothetical protein CENE_01065 [Candidatus Celerinatantimonas neptuna]